MSQEKCLPKAPENANKAGGVGLQVAQGKEGPKGTDVPVRLPVCCLKVKPVSG